MEELILESVKSISNSFDFTFCATCNILIYLIIKFIDDINGDKPVSTGMKRLITAVCIFICAFFYWITDTPASIVFNSSILTPVFWTWIAKPVIKKLGIDYRQKEEK